MRGKIIKGIAGFYYVFIENMGIVECKAKGIFRNRHVKPMVGDDVETEVIDSEHLLGNIVDILPRKNSLFRPAVANIDQAVIIFAAARPEPNYNLLSRFLLFMGRVDLPVIICFNKKDLVDRQRVEELTSIYKGSGSPVLFTSTHEVTGIDEIKNLLYNKTTVFAGPSGVGKSTITNLILPEANAETGVISSKAGRGKHTTRHSEMFCIAPNSYLFDTPGFSSLDVLEMDKEEVRFYFQEFQEYEGRCRFQGCVHINEPDCAVKLAVSDGRIHKIRYQNYLEIFHEVKNRKKY